MLLRIIDISGSNGAANAVRVEFESNEVNGSFVTDYHASQVADSFRKFLVDYYQTGPHSTAQPDNQPEVAAKLIKWGQNIGENLLGDDFQFIKFKDHIENKGYKDLRVQIESQRVEFFSEFWESLILYESNYILSSVINGYVRQFTQASFPDNYPDLFFNLSVASPPVDEVTKLLQPEGVTTKAQSEKAHSPLSVVYLLSRPKESELSSGISNSLNLYLDAISSGGSIDYDIIQSTDWNQLENRFSDRKKAIHVFHYDGPVIIEDGVPSIILTSLGGASSQISFHQLSKLMVSNKVPVLSIDARAYLNSSQSVSAAEGLALIARSAQECGLGNVIGLNQITSAWISGQCFQALFSQLMQGLNLEQSVVETRKALQSDTGCSLTTINPVPFHTWPLLVHYSKQEVTFFEPAQTEASPSVSTELEQLYSRLFGFRATMLPPLLSHASDGLAMRLIDHIVEVKRSGYCQAISLVGEAGIGKTQLTHVVSLYLALKEEVAYGFYLNFAKVDYTPSDVLEMIAPVLEIDPREKIKVQEKLAEMRCCFVFDDLPADESPESNNSGKVILQFIEELISQDHIVMVTGELELNIKDSVTFNFEMEPLPSAEQRVVAANAARHLGLPDERVAKIDHGPELDKLLEKSSGNPWLIKRLMTQLSISDFDKLEIDIAQQIAGKIDQSKVDSFYTWQWEKLNPEWQKLLLLCSDVQGLLLETLLMPLGDLDSFQPAAALLSTLGCKDVDYAELLNGWERSGFVSRLPHGRIINERFETFLDKKGEACLDSSDELKLKFYFSQVVCEGIRRLALHVVKQPNHNISNNLLLNRRSWAELFETLWFNGDYRGFMGAKTAFDQLLQQANLSDESRVWVTDMLGRAAVPGTSGATTLEEQLSWLALATSTLEKKEASDSTHILAGVETWQTWLNSFDEINKTDLSLFHHVVVFLESFYLSKSMWRDCIVICDKAYDAYLKYEAWTKVIQSLKSLARCHYELGEENLALICEDKVLYDIPYADAPPGFQAQKMLDILMVRLSRHDTHNAQILLSEIRKTTEADKLKGILDDIQCEIYFRDKNYSAALPYYCKTWARVVGSNQPAQIEQLRTKLLELKEKLGAAYFNDCFEREVPAGTIGPDDNVTLLH